MNGAGIRQWAHDGIYYYGVPVCIWPGKPSIPRIASDGAGGAIITWGDDRIYQNFDIYAQHMNAAGVPQSTAAGVALCTAVNNQYSPVIASDGARGAFVTWKDYRSGTTSDIYVQRVDAAGVPQGTADGVPVCTALNDQVGPMIIPDGKGGAIVTWQDFRNPSGDIFAQRVNATGAPQWTADGVAICTAIYDQSSPAIATDDAGGAIVTWYDFRSATSNDIYAQNIRADGALGGDIVPVLVSLISADAYADHVSLQWYTHELSSVVILRATPGEAWVEIARAAPDGTGKISFTDYSVTPGARYGYRLASAASVDGASYGETWVEVPQASGFALKGLRPNPSVRGLTVQFSLADAVPARLEVLDIGGRSILARDLSGLGAGNHTIDLAEGRVMPPGVYLVRLVQGSRSLTARGVVIR